MGRFGGWLCYLTVLSLLLSPQQAVEVHHILVQAEITQSYDELGEFMFQLDNDEIFYVHSPKNEVVWKLPDFQNFTSFEAQGAVGNLAVDKKNLEVFMKRSNYTKGTNAPPLVKVFPQSPIELGEPNVLICFMNQFFPPVINATWKKNGIPIYEGVRETDFYPNLDFPKEKSDYSFGKYLYLTFIPQQGDTYTCSVDHWGLENPIHKFWEINMSSPPSEWGPNAVCAVGLAVGIIGVIIGTVLIVKAMKNNSSRRDHH